MANWNELGEREKTLGYPGNMLFDPETLKPYDGETAEREKHINKWIPELNGVPTITLGKSLIDIGCNKGWVCLRRANGWATIVGFEPRKEYAELAQAIADAHFPNGEHNRPLIVHGDMRSIPPGHTWRRMAAMSAGQKIEGLERWGRFSVVYAGSVHHHWFRDATRYDQNPYLWCYKLKSLCADICIIDGPVDPTDPTMMVFSKEEDWGGPHDGFSAESIAEHMGPEFLLTRMIPNERRRWTMVFKRMADLPEICVGMTSIEKKENGGYRLELTHPSVDMLYILRYAQEIPANPARRYPVYKFPQMPHGELQNLHCCLKLDPCPLSQPTFGILNAMPDCFPRTVAIAVGYDGRECGTIAEWRDGRRLETPAELWPHWLRINNELAAVGLWEPHFKPQDYVDVGDTVLDVDVDMIQSPFYMRPEYMQKWLAARIDNLPEREKQWRYLVDHITDPGVFHKLYMEAIYE